MPSVSVCAELYASLCSYAIPIALVFGLSNMIVDTILTAAFGGGLRFGGGRNGR